MVHTDACKQEDTTTHWCLLKAWQDFTQEAAEDPTRMFISGPDQDRKTGASRKTSGLVLPFFIQHHLDNHTAAYCADDKHDHVGDRQADKSRDIYTAWNRWCIIISRKHRVVHGFEDSFIKEKSPKYHFIIITYFPCNYTERYLLTLHFLYCLHAFTTYLNKPFDESSFHDNLKIFLKNRDSIIYQFSSFFMIVWCQIT